METTELGIFKSPFMFLQPLKASSPIFVNVAGNVIPSKLVQLLKSLTPISAKCGGNLTVFNEVQFENISGQLANVVI